MRARSFIHSVSLLAALAIPGPAATIALGADQPAGAATAGSCGMIVMVGGDILLTWVEGARTCDFPPHPWVLVGNVFLSAGTGAPGPVIGLNQNWQLLAANGDWFQLSVDYNYCGAASASYLGNVFAQTGVSMPGEKFVTFGGGGPSGGNEYAATNYGRVYRWDNCTAGAAWSYIGALPLAPTGASRQSWGALRQIYR